MIEWHLVSVFYTEDLLWMDLDSAKKELEDFYAS